MLRSKILSGTRNSRLNARKSVIPLAASVPSSSRSQTRRLSTDVHHPLQKQSASSPDISLASTDSDPSYSMKSVSKPLRGVSTPTSLVWPRPSNVHETWHNVRKNLIPEGWSNDWRTWRLTPLFGPPHDPRELELELTVAHELPRPVRPIIYSRRSSHCFVFQAGAHGDLFHWDDETGMLNRIVTGPQTNVEEFLKSFRSCKLNGPGSELVPRTTVGRDRFNQLRREQHRRDAEMRERTIKKEQLNYIQFQFLNTFDDLIEIQRSIDDAHGQMAGFNTHDDL